MSAKIDPSRLDIPETGIYIVDLKIPSNSNGYPIAVWISEIIDSIHRIGERIWL